MTSSLTAIFPAPPRPAPQIFETSDLPAGVVNIITGDRDHLTKYLSEHLVRIIIHMFILFLYFFFL